MMKIKDLRELIANCDDDCIVTIGMRQYKSGRMSLISYQRDIEKEDSSCPFRFTLLVDDPHPYGANENRIPDGEFRSGLRKILLASIGSDYAYYLVNDDVFYEGVKHNVEETSAWHDEGTYTDDDIRLAIGRVLLDKFNISYT